MAYEKDDEILELKRKAGVDYRDLANALGISPNAVTRRVLGFQTLSGKERITIIGFLQKKIKSRLNP